VTAPYNFAWNKVSKKPIFHNSQIGVCVMAQYEHLPIYRDAFKFLIYCETIFLLVPTRCVGTRSQEGALIKNSLIG